MMRGSNIKKIIKLNNLTCKVNKFTFINDEKYKTDIL